MFTPHESLITEFKMYASKQDILDRYGEDLLWTIARRAADPDDPESEDALDDTAIERALSDATDEINARLNARYELPLPTIPTLLSRSCVDLAVFNLATGPELSEEIEKRANRATTLLSQIGTGKVDLGLPKAQKPLPSGGIGLVQEGRSDFANWSP